jgi:hypothetical protein
LRIGGSAAPDDAAQSNALVIVATAVKSRDMNGHHILDRHSHGKLNLPRRACLARRQPRARNLAECRAVDDVAG